MQYPPCLVNKDGICEDTTSISHLHGHSDKDFIEVLNLFKGFKESMEQRANKTQESRNKKTSNKNEGIGKLGK